MTSPEATQFLSGMQTQGGDKLANPANVRGLPDDFQDVPGIARDYVPFNYSAVTPANTANVFRLEKIGGRRIYVCSLEVIVSTSSPVTETVITIQDGDGGKIIWREVIAANAPLGTRVGWIRDRRPLFLSYSNDYILTVPAGGAGSIFIVNTDGFQG